MHLKGVNAASPLLEKLMAPVAVSFSSRLNAKAVGVRPLISGAVCTGGADATALVLLPVLLPLPQADTRLDTSTT